ncbi:MAG: hypothetical protein AB8F95_12285 [Bacteroidia bacterium]
MAAASFWYYPKWQKETVEATISWDVSGYYWYLPAVFIYDDVKELKWGDEVRGKYVPTTHDLQSFYHEKSGKRVLKYPAGMAVQYMPFFFAAHALAPTLGYPADGFSRPYQFAIQFGSLLFCFVGLWFLRKVLVEYFSDKAVAWLILLYVIGTNYLNYAAIDTALTHNWLFSWYAILMWLSHRYYAKPAFRTAALIGLTLGIMGLTRPTELMAAIIPAAWGLNRFSIADIKERFQFVWQHKMHYLLAGLFCGLVGLIQLLYWKHVTGEFFIYAYQDQHISWENPHLIEYAFHYRSGWLIYTPMMIFSYLGLVFLVKRKIQILPVVILMAFSYYVTSAWDIWWYGGRAMIQYYPIMAFPFLALLEWIDTKKILRYAFLAAFAVCAYLNIWWTFHAHTGSLLDVGNMTKPYYQRVIGRWEAPEDTRKLLDTDQIFEGERANITTVYENDFEQDSTAFTDGPIIQGTRSMRLDKDHQYSPKYIFPIQNEPGKWLRVSGTFSIPQKEWNFWMMPQLIVVYTQNGEEVNRSSIRLHRFMHDGQTRSLFVDSQIPEEKVDAVEIILWNADGHKTTYFDELKAEVFEEK